MRSKDKTHMKIEGIEGSWGPPRIFKLFNLHVFIS